MANKGNKTQYYVWYMGWKECHGLSGREFTEPIVRELLVRRRSEELPKLTIEITKKELKVVQLVEKKKGKIEKVKYPAIPSRDVTYATQALYPDEDVVACIYLGYNARTQCAVHTHVYRCDSPDTAALFVENIKQLVQLPEHQNRIRKIEQELFEKGQIMLRPKRPERISSNNDMGRGPPQYMRQNSGGSSGRNSDEQPGVAGNEVGRSDSYRSNRSSEDSGVARFVIGSGSTESEPYSPRSPHSPNSPNSVHERMPPVFDDAEGERREAESDPQLMSLADELKARLGSKNQAPLLLPPKDYDTIHRKRGNLLQVENRKCLNKEIVGKSGVYKIASDDSARGDSDGSSNKNSHEGDENENTFILGQTNQPSPREPQYTPRSPMQDPVVFTSKQKVPFSPGPNTKDLKRESYFPSKEELPNYLPTQGHERKISNGSSGGQSGLGRMPERKKFAKQVSSPEFRNLPDYQRRHPDEGYTSMGRHGDYPQSQIGSEAFGPPPSMLSRNGSEGYDLSRTVPAYKAPVRRGSTKDDSRGSSRENSRRSSRENVHSPRVYMDQRDPGAYVPIDYTVAKRHPKVQRAGSGYY